MTQIDQCINFFTFSQSKVKSNHVPQFFKSPSLTHRLWQAILLTTIYYTTHTIDIDISSKAVHI